MNPDIGATTFEFEGSSYALAPGEFLLDALLRQGAELPHSCRRGSCHTCVLKVEAGEVESSRQVDSALAAASCTLACVARPTSAGVRIRRVNADELSFKAELLERRQLAEGVFALDIAPLRALTWRAGQFLQLRGPEGQQRPYSIASRSDDDYFLTIHVRRVADGRVSSWLCDDIQPGQHLHLSGPFGNCCYDSAMRDRPLCLLATGSGIGALAALAREALALGHRAGVVIHHGVRRASDLYLHQELQALQRSNPLITYVPVVSREDARPAIRHGRVIEAAFTESPPADTEIFLCGLPHMVEEARYRARRCGIPALRIHADAFEFSHPPAPRDAEKLAAIEPDPELWAALEHGRDLTRILNAFYALVFADPRLAPFFHHVSATRAAQKQYEFLASLFSGSGHYFGLNPFNAHHWMVISDELFDYREALFERVLRDHGLAPHLIDRWMALHEIFRTDIVKSRARGMISQGVEQALRTHSVERLDIDSLCDACGKEIPAGSPSRYLFRLGVLHCAACAGIRSADAPARIDRCSA